MLHSQLRVVNKKRWYLWSWTMRYEPLEKAERHLRRSHNVNLYDNGCHPRSMSWPQTPYRWFLLLAVGMASASDNSLVKFFLVVGCLSPKLIIVDLCPPGRGHGFCSCVSPSGKVPLCKPYVRIGEGKDGIPKTTSMLALANRVYQQLNIRYGSSLPAPHPMW